MRMYRWIRAPEIGSYVKMVEFDGSPCLQSAPMLVNGDREDSICDVCESAFTESELGIYSRYLASIFHCTTKAITDSIRHVPTLEGKQ